ncbi:hypothetical protein SteCoe_29562 [Stentor coeruleus]|uniref:Uncharacterized protein n=1 Tax=Stentor coeruleus TaxID=5963 RepID=A0A1R2B5L7_9CILI|nr:hypothetical protein SteCoe_29562 [Stentor coeruleus]
MRSRAEDPNISLRVIEKIKDKCKDYYRDTAGVDITVLVNNLIYDIMLFKKDCLVAAELAQQYIMKSVDGHSKNVSHEDFKKNFEVDRLNEENTSLKLEICALKSEIYQLQEFKENDTFAPQTHTEASNSEIQINNEELEELRQKVNEYESSMIVQEMKYENTILDLENEKKANQKQITQLKASLSESLSKIDVLEKKLKDSLSNYSRFLVRKPVENRECQTIVRNFSIIHIDDIDLPRTYEFDMGHISKMSINDSEIFDMSLFKNFNIEIQESIWVPPMEKMEEAKSSFGVDKKIEIKMEEIWFSEFCEPVKKVRDLRDYVGETICINSMAKPKLDFFMYPIINSKPKLDFFIYKIINSKPKLDFFMYTNINSKANLSITALGSYDKMPEKKPALKKSLKEFQYTIFPIYTKKTHKLELSQQSLVKISRITINKIAKLSEVYLNHFLIHSQPKTNKLLSQSAEYSYIIIPSYNKALSKYHPILSLTGQGLINIIKPQVKLNELKIFPIFSKKAKLRVKKVTKMLIESTKSYRKLQEASYKIVKNDGILIAPGAAEETKSTGTARRRRTETQRKPAIEEYFSLTYQAIKMKGVKKDKILSSDELYVKASTQGIQFFDWYEWLKVEMNK